jgi:hypothetical protein
MNDKSLKKIQLDNLKGRDNFGDISIDVRIILKLMLNEYWGTGLD